MPWLERPCADTSPTGFYCPLCRGNALWNETPAVRLQEVARATPRRTNVPFIRTGCGVTDHLDRRWLGESDGRAVKAYSALARRLARRRRRVRHERSDLRAGPRRGHRHALLVKLISSARSTETLEAVALAKRPATPGVSLHPVGEPKTRLSRSRVAPGLARSNRSGPYDGARNTTNCSDRISSPVRTLRAGRESRTCDAASDRHVVRWLLDAWVSAQREQMRSRSRYAVSTSLVLGIRYRCSRVRGGRWCPGQCIRRWATPTWRAGSYQDLTESTNIARRLCTNAALHAALDAVWTAGGLHFVACSRTVASIAISHLQGSIRARRAQEVLGPRSRDLDGRDTSPVSLIRRTPRTAELPLAEGLPRERPYYSMDRNGMGRRNSRTTRGSSACGATRSPGRRTPILRGRRDDEF